MITKDPEGKEYIDFTSGIGVNCLGHADKGGQMRCSNRHKLAAHIESVQHTAGVEVAEKLCEYTGFPK